MCGKRFKDSVRWREVSGRWSVGYGLWFLEFAFYFLFVICFLSFEISPVNESTMSGYPCCCRQPRQCGECHGTAPLQYQLTVLEGLLRNNPDAYPQGCGDACEQYNGVFLLDYDAELSPLTSPYASCIWQSPAFEACYECHGTFDSEEDIDPEPIVCTSIEWNWRVEIAEDFEEDGYVAVYAVLFDTSYNYSYVWSGVFHLDCSTPIELQFEPVFLYLPAPGCIPDPAGTLLLEVPA